MDYPHRPDVAMLDYLLKDGECWPLINALQRRQVPIVVHSGWLADKVDMPLAISDLLWLSKPVDCNNLLEALAGAAP